MSEDEAENKRRLNEYTSLLKDVKELKEMCDMEPFRKFYRHMMEIKADHDKNWKKEEKTKDMVARQQQSLFIETMQDYLGKQVNELNDYCHQFPLFAQDFKTRAKWIPELGVVELTTSE